MKSAHRRVLVVEDDTDIRDALVWCLQDEGYHVDAVPDGKLALERLRASQDGVVVLLDMNMPGMDGLAVLEAVAAQEQLARRHAFILVTAYGGRTLPLTLANLLLDLHVPVLAKPFELDAVVAAVRQAEHRLAE